MYEIIQTKIYRRINNTQMVVKRHFIGRPKDVSDSDSSSGSESEQEEQEEQQEVAQHTQSPAIRAPSTQVSAPSAPSKPASSIPVGLTNYSQVDKVVAEQRGQRKPVQGYDTISKEESSEEESESEEESDESSEEEEAKTFVKPKFIPKNKRQGAVTEVPKIVEKDNSARTLEYIEKRIRAEQEAQRALYEEENAAEFGGVDDTDDLDVVAELEEWKIREKGRLERDRNELIAREEALERADQNEPTPVEIGEGVNHWDAREEKTEKAKGAFYQEQDILKRDMSGPMQDDYVDKTNVPKSLLGQNVGQKGRIMRKSLKEEDTSRKRTR